MRLRVQSPRDVGGALLLIVIAGLLWWGQRSLRMGTAVNMGPAYVPNILAWCILGVGILLIFRSLRVSGPKLKAFAWRPLITVIGSLLVFAALIESAGLVSAGVATVMICAAAIAGYRWKSTALLAATLTAFSIALFKVGLGLAMTVWPKWI